MNRPGHIDSNIISTEILHYELWNVCGLKINQNFKPLYRGSENEFSWKEFHTQCDNISPTLVIVKSADGCIFGGYTKTKWNCTSEYWVADSEAYLFRLQTAKIESKKYPVVNNKKAIYCGIFICYILWSGDLPIQCRYGMLPTRSQN